MRPPRLVVLLFCFIFLPIFLTFLSLVTAQPSRESDADSSRSGRSSRSRALFSFNAPASLFPPSAIISLTDDNSTFFLARPAAFGPLLPPEGLSGQLWIGSGFGDEALQGGAAANMEGELGCSDVPGWDQRGQSKPITSAKGDAKSSASDISADSSQTRSRRSAADSTTESKKSHSIPSADDGTDDHLLQSLSAGDSGHRGDGRQSAHADIQSLQESAEIAGKVVLLSRGGCGFLDKVLWVQRRGGIGVIVGDNTKGGSLVTMYARGDTSNVTIPAVFTSYTTAHLLSSLVPAKESTSHASKELGIKNQQPAQATVTSTGASTAATSARPDANNAVSSSSGNSFMRTFLSVFGLGGKSGYPWYLTEDSRRPPSSGNLDWVVVDDFEDEERRSRASSVPSSAPNRGNTQDVDGGKGGKNADKQTADEEDDLEIGEHDGRDPDLTSRDTIESGSDSDSKDNEGRDRETSLDGGSIVPGSGEYVTESSDDTNKAAQDGRVASSATAEPRKEGWFAKLFGSGASKDEGPDDADADSHNRGQAHVVSVPERPAAGPSTAETHEGLWVTITPTSMSASPFFDTLLVLVISPLVTLTVVYALLLLRSRIRRRRWRAPKSVVDRLPVRTYHTISSQPSTGPSSPRSPPSPGAVTPTSPLLGSSREAPSSGRLRGRSQTISGSVMAAGRAQCSGERSGSSSHRRRYIGRQVECVVCLEEYIDGQSRVMSLPCGHEFHAECMYVYHIAFPLSINGLLTNQQYPLADDPSTDMSDLQGRCCTVPGGTRFRGGVSDDG